MPYGDRGCSWPSFRFISPGGKEKARAKTHARRAASSRSCNDRAAKACRCVVFFIIFHFILPFPFLYVHAKGANSRFEKPKKRKRRRAFPSLSSTP